MNGLGQRLYKDFANGRYFRVWIIQSAGIGDMVETFCTYKTALNLIGGSDFANEVISKRTHFIVNEFVLPFLRLVEGVDEANVHVTFSFTDHLVDPVTPAAGDYLIDLTDRGFQTVINRFPRTRIFCPFKTATSIKSDRAKSKYRFWLPEFTMREGPACEPRFDSFEEFPILQFKKIRPAESSSSKVAIFPFSRDGGPGNVNEDHATGRSLGPEFVAEMASIPVKAAFFGEAYHWLENQSEKLKAHGCTDHIWKNALSFEEMVAKLISVSAVVTVDTSAAHLAAALGKRTVVLLDDRSPSVVHGGLASVPKAPHVVPFICGLREKRTCELAYYRLGILRILSKMGARI